VHQAKIHKMKNETKKKQLSAILSKKGGQRIKEVDDGMALRNTNVRANSLLKSKRNDEEISRKNLILGKKIQGIYSRKKSFYGETEPIS